MNKVFFYIHFGSPSGTEPATEKALVTLSPNEWNGYLGATVDFAVVGIIKAVRSVTDAVLDDIFLRSIAALRRYSCHVSYITQVNNQILSEVLISRRPCTTSCCDARADSHNMKSCCCFVINCMFFLLTGVLVMPEAHHRCYIMWEVSEGKRKNKQF